MLLADYTVLLFPKPAKREEIFPGFVLIYIFTMGRGVMPAECLPVPGAEPDPAGH